MPVDAIQERGHFDQLVARIDELEIKEILFARHGENVRWESREVNREATGIFACGAGGDGVWCVRVRRLRA